MACFDWRGRGRLGYRWDAHMRQQRLTAIVLAATAAACVEQVIDLRPSAPQALECEAGERLDPESERCAPCVVRSPGPDEECSCGHVYLPGPFPYCEHSDAYYECSACQGDITACSSYAALEPTAEDCRRLRACCAELEDSAGSTPCCAPSETVFCEIDSISRHLVFQCVGPSCCEGNPCEDAGGCEPWQVCDPVSQRCLPPCHPDRQYCCETCGDGCECRDSGSPP